MINGGKDAMKIEVSDRIIGLAKDILVKRGTMDSDAEITKLDVQELIAELVVEEFMRGCTDGIA